jgi:hypothetical protein
MGCVLALPVRLWRALIRRRGVATVGDEAAPHAGASGETFPVVNVTGVHPDTTDNGDSDQEPIIEQSVSHDSHPVPDNPESHVVNSPSVSGAVADDLESQTSIDSSVEDADSLLPINEEQLFPILHPAESPEADTPDGEEIVTSTTNRPERDLPLVPPTFYDLLTRFGLDKHIMQYLDYTALTSLVQLFPSLLPTMRDVFLHEIIPTTYIQLQTVYMEDGRKVLEYMPLFPVIRRVARPKRVLPYGRLIYEPDYATNKKYRYRLGQFCPHSVTFYLGKRCYVWPLGENRDRKVRCNRNRDSHFPTRDPDETLRSIYYKFKDDFQDARSDRRPHEDFPVNVFYKRIGGESQSAVLHVLSIPFDCLIERVAKSGSSHRPRVS